MTPLGFAAKDVPIVLDQHIIDSGLEFLWMGGGEVDVKWAIGVKDLIEKFNALTGHITNPCDDDM